MDRAKTLAELLQVSCTNYADRPLFGTRRDGSWQWLSYREFSELVARARAGLAGLGIGPGDRVAVIGDNSVEWAVVAYATYGLGATFVPMYPAQKLREWQFILADSAARVVFVASDAIATAVQAARSQLPQLARVIGFERVAAAPLSWRELLAAGAAQPVRLQLPEPEAIASFMYTSGTTGNPKGVCLSHHNMMSNIDATTELFAFQPDDRTLSFLPWAHIYGQMSDLHIVISYGGSTALNDDPLRLFHNMAEIKPTLFVGVPRIYNRVYDAIRHELGDQADFSEALTHQFLLQTIRDRFGGRLRYAFCGSAALAKEVAELIQAAGIELFEGYGLTETSPTVTTNWPDSRRPGSVGRVVPGVRVVIDYSVRGGAADGEIVVYGPNVMAGYHARLDEQRRTLMPDGGLRTGDLGRLDGDGFLYLTGRIKEQYKLENGKYVMPAPLEEVLKLSPYIANCTIYGDNRPHNVALVVPDLPAVRGWAADLGVQLGSDVTTDEAVRKLLTAEVERLSVDFKGFEKPRAIAVLGADFTIENGLLTPTLKIRRREIVARYAAVLEALYARPPITSTGAAPRASVAR